MNYRVVRNDSLAHFGILGMKWGKRNGPPYPLSGSSMSSSEKKRETKTHLIKRKAETEASSEQKEKFHLTDQQKKWIKIGAIAAGTALAAYAGYKLYQSGALDGLVSKGRAAVDVSNTPIHGSEIFDNMPKYPMSDEGVKQATSYSYEHLWRPAFEDLNTKCSPQDILQTQKYTGHNYKAINQFLRGEIDSLDDEDRAILDSTRSVMSKMSLPEDTVVYRGVGAKDIAKILNVPEAQLSNPGSLIGHTYTEKAFVSTSVHPKSAYQKVGNIMIRAFLPEKANALYISPMSSKPEEYEVLVDCGKQFRVLAYTLDQLGNITDLDVEYIL